MICKRGGHLNLSLSGQGENPLPLEERGREKALKEEAFIFSLTIASIFSLSLLPLVFVFPSFDHIDGLITDRVVRYCCQNK